MATAIKIGKSGVEKFELTAEQAAQLVVVDDLVTTKAKKQKKINKAFELGIAAITKGILQAEIDTFDVQEAEAFAYQADPDADVPFITALAVSREIELPDLVSRILVKAASYKAAIAPVLGRKHKAEDQLAAATTVEQVEAIEV